MRAGKEGGREGGREGNEEKCVDLLLKFDRKMDSILRKIRSHDRDGKRGSDD